MIIVRKLIMQEKKTFFGIVLYSLLFQVCVYFIYQKVDFFQF